MPQEIKQNPTKDINLKNITVSAYLAVNQMAERDEENESRVNHAVITC